MISVCPICKQVFCTSGCVDKMFDAIESAALATAIEDSHTDEVGSE